MGGNGKNIIYLCIYIFSRYRFAYIVERKMRQIKMIYYAVSKRYWSYFHFHFFSTFILRFLLFFLFHFIFFAFSSVPPVIFDFIIYHFMDIHLCMLHCIYAICKTCLLSNNNNISNFDHQFPPVTTSLPKVKLLV